MAAALAPAHGSSATGGAAGAQPSAPSGIGICTSDAELGTGGIGMAATACCTGKAQGAELDDAGDGGSASRKAEERDGHKGRAGDSDPEVGDDSDFKGAGSGNAEEDGDEGADGAGPAAAGGEGMVARVVARDNPMVVAPDASESPPGA